MHQTDSDKLSKTNDVKVRSIGGLKMQQVENFIDSELEHKLDEVISHCGTNNVENDDEEEILRNFKTLSDSFSRDTKLTFSGIIPGADKPYLNEKVDKINTSIQKLCLMKGHDFINNNNMRFRHLTLFHMGGGGDSALLQIVFFITSVRDAAEPRNLVTFPKM